MQCPKCKNTQLLTRKAKGQNFTLEVCLNCRGIWFDKSELDKIVNGAAKDLSVPQKAFEQTILCPKCNNALYLFQYPQTMVNVDMCKKCGGLWLDAGEFKELQMVRNHIVKSADYKEGDDISEVRGALIRFIERNIEKLLRGKD